MELLTFMAANPWMSVFLLLVLSGFSIHLITAIKEAYINTIWCIRGIPPSVKFDLTSVNDLDDLEAAANKVINNKKEDDENKLKDCR